MDFSGLVINLQYQALFSLAVDLLVHDLDELEAAAVRYFFVDDWDGELVFECLQVQLLGFQLRQLAQGPILILLVLQNTHIVDFARVIFLQ